MTEQNEQKYSRDFIEWYFSNKTPLNYTEWRESRKSPEPTYKVRQGPGTTRRLLRKTILSTLGFNVKTKE